MSETLTITLPLRSEVDPKDCWDLTSLYASEEAWERDLAEAEARIPALQAFQGRLGEGAAVVRAFLDLDVESDRQLGKLHNFAARKSDQDTSDSHYMGLKERVTGVYTRVMEATAFFRSELVALDQAVLDGYLADEALAPFRFVLEQIARKKRYTLPEREERLLAMASDLARAPSDIFGQLQNADLRFGFVEDENKNRVEVTHGSYSSFLTKRDRSVRKRFFETYYKGFEGVQHTLAASLAAGVKRNVFFARARGYDSARHAALYQNDVPEAVYDNLISSVHDRLEVLYRYYDLRKRLLGLDEIHFYDLLVPVVPEVSLTHTYDEAVTRVVASLAPLGEDYTTALEHGLRHGWVDRYENRGKRSGAYSSGCYDSEPFILMNYKDDNLDHVYTLTHEAGHSMHSWSSNRTQPPQHADYSIFVAEVASTFNEALLTHHLLDQTDDPMMRAYIINREIDSLRGTLFRQTMFADYEHRLHRRAEEQKPLSLKDVTGLYREVLERYYGPRFSIDPCLELECLRIPHFYYNFYVFQYSTGISAAIALSEKVLHGGPRELEAYRGFLGAGGSGFPIDILRAAGVDMASPEPVRAALDHFGRRVDELERLLDKA